jgi:hypothetical protein
MSICDHYIRKLKFGVWGGYLCNFLCQKDVVQGLQTEEHNGSLLSFFLLHLLICSQIRDSFNLIFLSSLNSLSMLTSIILMKINSLES